MILEHAKVLGIPLRNLPPQNPRDKAAIETLLV
jgi:hypothetical protein